MSKRFTDPKKWKDTWFAELDERGKLLWLYLCDSCDTSGVWVVNAREASFDLGFPFDTSEALNLLGDRIEILGNGTKWNLKKFIPFQYPNGLSLGCVPQRSVLALLDKHNIPTKEVRPGIFYLSHTVPIQYPNSKPTVIDIDIDSSLNSSLQGSAEGELVATFPHAPIHLPSRLREPWSEVCRANGHVIASKTLEASTRLFHAPSEKQFLETWKCAHELGKIAAPSTEWPDFRVKIKRERAKQLSGGIGDVISDERLAAYNNLPFEESRE